MSFTEAQSMWLRQHATSLVHASDSSIVENVSTIFGVEFEEEEVNESESSAAHAFIDDDEEEEEEEEDEEEKESTCERERVADLLILRQHNDAKMQMLRALRKRVSSLSRRWFMGWRVVAAAKTRQTSGKVMRMRERRGMVCVLKHFAAWKHVSAMVSEARLKQAVRAMKQTLDARVDAETEAVRKERDEFASAHRELVSEAMRLGQQQEASVELMRDAEEKQEASAELVRVAEQRQQQLQQQLGELGGRLSEAEETILCLRGVVEAQDSVLREREEDVETLKIEVMRHLEERQAEEKMRAELSAELQAAREQRDELLLRTDKVIQRHVRVVTSQQDTIHRLEEQSVGRAAFVDAVNTIVSQALVVVRESSFHSVEMARMWTSKVLTRVGEMVLALKAPAAAADASQTTSVSSHTPRVVADGTTRTGSLYESFFEAEAEATLTPSSRPSSAYTMRTTQHKHNVTSAQERERGRASPRPLTSPRPAILLTPRQKSLVAKMNLPRTLQPSPAQPQNYEQAMSGLGRGDATALLESQRPGTLLMPMHEQQQQWQTEEEDHDETLLADFVNSPSLQGGHE